MNAPWHTLLTTLLQHNIIIYVLLTSTCWVHSNVCGLLITLFIRYHTVVNSILSTSPPVQKYHHITSGSVEVPLPITARNSSSIGKVPVPYGKPRFTSMRRSATNRLVSYAEQGIIIIFTNVLQGHDTVVLVCFTIQWEPNTSTWGTEVKDLPWPPNQYGVLPQDQLPRGQLPRGQLPWGQLPPDQLPTRSTPTKSTFLNIQITQYRV